MSFSDPACIWDLERKKNVHLKGKWEIIFGKRINREKTDQHEIWSFKKSESSWEIIMRFDFEDSGSKPILKRKTNTREDFEDNGFKTQFGKGKSTW